MIYKLSLNSYAAKDMIGGFFLDKKRPKTIVNGIIVQDDINSK